MTPVTATARRLERPALTRTANGAANRATSRQRTARRAVRSAPPLARDELLTMQQTCIRLRWWEARVLQRMAEWAALSGKLVGDEFLFTARSVEHCAKTDSSGPDRYGPCTREPLSVAQLNEWNTPRAVKQARKKAAYAWRLAGKAPRDPDSFTRAEIEPFIAIRHRAPRATNGDALITMATACRILRWTKGRVIDALARGVIFGEDYFGEYMLREETVRAFADKRGVGRYGDGPTLSPRNRRMMAAIMSARPERRDTIRQRFLEGYA